MALGTQPAEPQEGATGGGEETGNEDKPEEQPKKKVYPIAPDGYIPNSVIRRTMGFKPKEELKKEEPWKLKPLPLSAMPLLESADDDDIKMLSYADIESPEPVGEGDDGDGLLATADDESDKTAVTRRESTPETALDSQRSPSPEKEPSAEWKKKTSAKKSVTIIEEAQEDQLHPLLREIVSRPWFPPSAAHTLVGVISAFIGLMDVANEDVHTDICNFIIRLHNEMGLPEKELNRLVEKLIQQLENTDATKRANAARTLAELGISTDGVLTAVISHLTDEEPEVRKAAEMCLSHLKDDESKNRVVQYLQSIGAYTRTNTKLTEEELLKALAIYLQEQGDLDGGPESLDRVKDWLNGVIEQPAEDKTAESQDIVDPNSKGQDKNDELTKQDAESEGIDDLAQKGTDTVAEEQAQNQMDHDDRTGLGGDSREDDGNHKLLAADSGFVAEDDNTKSGLHGEDQTNENKFKEEEQSNWKDDNANQAEEIPENWRDFFDRPSSQSKQQAEMDRTKSAGQHALSPSRTLFPLPRRSTSFDSGVNARMVTGITIYLQDSGSRGSAKSRSVDQECDKEGSFKPTVESDVPRYGLTDMSWAGARHSGHAENERTRSQTDLSLPSINSASRYDRYGGGSANHLHLGGGTSNQFLPQLPNSAQDHQGDNNWERPPKGRKGKSASPYIPAPPKFHKHGRHDCLYYRMIKQGMHSHIAVGKYLLRKETVEMLANVKVPIKGLRTTKLLSS